MHDAAACWSYCLKLYSGHKYCSCKRFILAEDERVTYGAAVGGSYILQLDGSDTVQLFAGHTCFSCVRVIYCETVFVSYIRQSSVITGSYITSESNPSMEWDRVCSFHDYNNWSNDDHEQQMLLRWF